MFSVTTSNSGDYLKMQPTIKKYSMYYYSLTFYTSRIYFAHLHVQTHILKTQLVFLIEDFFVWSLNIIQLKNKKINVQL